MEGSRNEKTAEHRVDGTGERAYAPTLLATAAWFSIPLIIYVAWTLAFASNKCADGSACGSIQKISEGVSAAMPWAFPSLALSLLMSVLLRLPAVGWRSSATGAAATILGCGLTTVILMSFGYDIG